MRRIDLSHESLLPMERQALQLMLDKRQYYVDQCRPREAHGAAAVILIAWRALIEDFSPTQPTGWGEL
jgi:hypothetical protein